jgi:hypothetical protein
VVEKEGDGAQLSLGEAMDKWVSTVSGHDLKSHEAMSTPALSRTSSSPRPRRFLVEPLSQLDTQRRSGAVDKQPAVLLLLDALDESDDGGKGWEPVARLVARE